MSSLVQNKDSDSEDEGVPEVEQVEVQQGPAEPEEVTTCANSDVQTKYLEAAKIANAVLQEVMAAVSDILSFLILFCL
jgi:hypothetical protein